MINFNTPKISVIIPVYNAENFLEKTIYSIINQSFTDLEIILVDDGSTDRSLEICRNLEQNDKRIKVVTKTNEGVASARQQGMMLATGLYIIHADSDDYVLPQAYENLYASAESTDADITIGSYLKGSLENPTLITHETRLDNSSDLINSLLLGTVHGSLWNKLIKRELYNELEFEAGLDFMEDLLIIIQMLVSNKNVKITVVDVPVYHYVFRAESYTNKLTLKYLQIGDEIVKRIEQSLSVDSIFNKSLTHFKLFHKLLYLLNTDTVKNNICNIFPEVNSKVWSSSLAFKYKIMLTFELKNIHFITRTYKYFKK
jgi:glycosyltransferase involved in cell wall biosynthesis